MTNPCNICKKTYLQMSGAGRGCTACDTCDKAAAYDRYRREIAALGWKKAIVKNGCWIEGEGA